MLRTYFLSISGLIAICIVTLQCKHEAFLSDIPTHTGVCQSDTVYFERDVLPIIVSQCTQSGCHNAGDNTAGYTLTKYSLIVHDAITAFKPDQSELYKVISRGSMPPRQSLPADQTAIIRKWIEQGALNLSCDDMSPCNTDEVSFKAAILPIMQAACTGCHSGNNPSGGIALSDYSSISANANSGKLLGSIQYLPGYSPMPKGIGKLDDCKISKVEAWINQGSKDN
ncbi:MAG: hypothetical protein WCR52_07125 [Bacteroidota bacterium]